MREQRFVELGSDISDHTVKSLGALRGDNLANQSSSVSQHLCDGLRVFRGGRFRYTQGEHDALEAPRDLAADQPFGASRGCRRVERRRRHDLGLIHEFGPTVEAQ
jgi:hypothetical protein